VRFFILSPLLCFMATGCSWVVGFYITNPGNKPQRVTIELEKSLKGSLIFNPRDFTLYTLKGDTLDFETARMLSAARAPKHEIEIPAGAALQIGRLSNEDYKNSRQRFINGRIFNLVQITSGKHRVTLDTFDTHFKKTDTGYAWQLPVE
jgi:hypothetical protein